MKVWFEDRLAADGSPMRERYDKVIDKLVEARRAAATGMPDWPAMLEAAQLSKSMYLDTIPEEYWHGTDILISMVVEAVLERRAGDGGSIR